MSVTKLFKDHQIINKNLSHFLLKKNIDFQLANVRWILFQIL